MQRLVPSAVAGLRPARALALGGEHTCALTLDGAVYCWGTNTSGQLGDGSTTGRNSPTRVEGLDRVMGITAGTAHTCALVDDGTVRCWGATLYGQTGDGALGHVTTPERVTL
jgi:alpha-tubulin suppressor-like RCC1 family protein